MLYKIQGMTNRTIISNTKMAKLTETIITLKTIMRIINMKISMGKKSIIKIMMLINFHQKLMKMQLNDSN